MADTLHLDFETRSVVDLRACGVYRYAEDPSTSVLCMAYAFGYGKVEGWQRGQPFPQEVIDHVRGGGLVAAHNAVFERDLWNEALARQVPGLPILLAENMDCTMARAYAMGLPGSLDDAASAMKLDYRKDPGGYAVMLKMCKPRGYNKDGTPFWWDEPEMFNKLMSYCKADVLVEQELDARLPKLTPQERKVWLLDQTINDRGVALALDIIPRASEVGEVAKKWAGNMLRGLTGGAVKTVNQSAATIDWLQGRGFDCDSMAKQEIEGLLLQAVQREDAVAEAAIRLKSDYAKSSIDKLDAMLRCANKDERARGLLAYYATHTGRWAGRLVQPQNLARVDWDADGELIVIARDMLATAKNAAEAAEALKLLDENVVAVLAKTIRSMFIAGDGKRLFGGDFSNIEGRLNAWVSGEHWKIKAFEDYDAGTGPDLYKLAYSKAFAKELAMLSKSDRQIGKVMELALGYQGGVGAFQNMAALYGVKVSDEDAQTFKKAWREANPCIVSSWWAYNDAAIAAVGSPGEKFEILGGKVAYIAHKGFLFCRLPSGRIISYPFPRLVKTDTPVGERWAVEYYGQNSKTKQWGWQRLYGGLLCNNVVQGAARDVLVEAMFNVEAAGFPLVLTVHDELISEAARKEADEAIFKAALETKPQWATGLPLTASTWNGLIYGK